MGDAEPLCVRGDCRLIERHAEGLGKFRRGEYRRIDEAVRLAPRIHPLTELVPRIYRSGGGCGRPNFSATS